MRGAIIFSLGKFFPGSLALLFRRSVFCATRTRVVTSICVTYLAGHGAVASCVRVDLLWQDCDCREVIRVLGVRRRRTALFGLLKVCDLFVVGVICYFERAG